MIITEIFTKKFIKLTNTNNTKTLGNVINDIYKQKKYYCIGENFTADEFNKAKKQMIKLLDIIYSITQFNLFNHYLNKINELNFEISTKISINSSLGFAKKTLEDSYDAIIKNYKKVDRSFIENFNINECYAGAANNIKFATECFMDLTSLEQLLCATKIECCRELISQYIITSDFCHDDAMQIHYFIGLYNIYANKLNIEPIEDELAPTRISVKHQNGLAELIEKNFLNSFITILLKKLEENIGGLELDKQKSLSDKNFLETLTNYNAIFNCNKNDLGIIRLFQADKENLEYYTPVENIEEILHAWIVEQLVNQGYLNPKFLISINNSKIESQIYILNDLNFITLKENHRYQKASLDNIINILGYFADIRQKTKDHFLNEINLQLLWKTLINNYDEYYQISEILKLRNINIDQKSSTGETLIFFAARQELLEVIAQIIKYNPEAMTHTNNNRETPIFVAAENGKKRVVEFFIENKADLSIGNNQDETPLDAAIIGGHFDIAMTIIDHYDNDINVKNILDQTPLMTAVKNNQYQMALNFLENGAAIDLRDSDQHTALILAAYNNDNENIIKILIQYGADLNSFDIEGNSALHMACKNGKLSVVKYLIEKGAAINQTDKYGESALWKAIENKHEHVANYLIEIGADTQRPLYNACAFNNTQIVEFLIKKRTNLNKIIFPEGKTPFMIACIKKRKKIINEMLKNKVDVNYQDELGRTALYFAAEAGLEDIVEILMNAGANFNIKCIQNDLTPLTIADKKQHKDLVLFMIKKILKFYEKNINRNTILQKAATYDNEDILKILITNKELINQTNIFGRTAFHCAVIHGNLSACKILFEAGEKNSVCHDGQTLMHVAAEKGHLQIVKFLIDNKLHKKFTNYTNKLGKNALCIATEKCHYEIMQMLLLAGEDPLLSANNALSALEIANYKDDITAISIIYNDPHYIIETIKKGKTNLVLNYFKISNNINKINKEKGSIIAVATENSELKIIDLLLKLGANADTRNIDGSTPLLKAAAQGNLEVTKKLINAGACIDIQDYNKISPLMAAAENGHTAIIEYILPWLKKEPRAIDKTDNSGNTALSLAAMNNHVEIIKSLMKFGAQLNKKNNKGDSPLHLAVKHCSYEAIKVLIDCGADIFLENNKRQTPLTIASDNGLYDIKKILLKAQDIIEHQKSYSSYNF